MSTDHIVFDNIDAWSGGLAEDAHEGGSLGELNSCARGTAGGTSTSGYLDEATLTDVQAMLLVCTA